jgi:protein-disulfide isomerase
VKTLHQLVRHRLLAWAPFLVLIAACSSVAVASPRVSGVDRVLALLKGIPQNGVTLGDPSAPAELVEFADLQCPYCAEANTQVLPPLIDKYVRTGQVKLVFRSLTFLGPDSVKAALTAASMGQQNHLWDFVELFFANQGREGSGYVTDAFVKKLATAVPGADVGRAMAQRNDASVTSQLDEAKAEARRLSVEATPTFFLVKPGQPPKELQPSLLTPEGFGRALK